MQRSVQASRMTTQKYFVSMVVPQFAGLRQEIINFKIDVDVTDGTPTTDELVQLGLDHLKAQLDAAQTIYIRKERIKHASFTETGSRHGSSQAAPTAQSH